MSSKKNLEALHKASTALADATSATRLALNLINSIGYSNSLQDYNQHTAMIRAYKELEKATSLLDSRIKAQEGTKNE